MPTSSAEDEVKKTMISQFQAQEKKVTDGLKEVQASSVHERTQLHKQLQDANVKLALAAEVILLCFVCAHPVPCGWMGSVL